MRKVKRKTLQRTRLGISKPQHWQRKLFLFCKIFEDKKSCYLSHVIPTRNVNHNRNKHKINLFHDAHLFKVFSTNIVQDKSPTIQSVPTLGAFKKDLLKFIRSSSNSVFDFQKCKGITRLCLAAVSHLHEHKNKHIFLRYPESILLM